MTTTSDVTLVCACGTRVAVWRDGRLELRAGRNHHKKRRGGRATLPTNRVDLAHNYGREAVSFTPAVDPPAWHVTFADTSTAMLPLADAQPLAIAAGLSCTRCWVWFDLDGTYSAGRSTARQGRSSITLRRGQPWATAANL